MIERLRELEKKWRAVAEKQWRMATPAVGVPYDDGHARMEGMAERTEYMADELATLIAELGQEVGAVAWPSERVSIADPHEPGYRIVGFKISESHPWHGKYGLSEPLDALGRAIAASPAHTSEARDAARSEAYDKVDRFLRNTLMDAAYAENSDALEIACGYQDAAMRQEGGNG